MRPARTLTVIAVLVLAALLTTGCEWHFETLDGHQSGPAGQTDNEVGPHSSAVIYNGRPHVFYWDLEDGDLRHAYYNGAFWAFETLDGHQNGPDGRIDSNVGSETAAVIYNSRPHVFYYDSVGTNLRHGYYNGVAWVFETLDGQGPGPYGRAGGAIGIESSVVLYNGRPHVFYYASTGSDLRHAYYNGQFWAFETLDGTTNGPNGRLDHVLGNQSSVVLYNGRPHVFYDDSTDDALRHAYYNGQFWAFETLDGNGGPNGRINANVGTESSLILYKGRPHVFYHDEDNGDLRHGYFNGGAWIFETLDGAGGGNGRTTSIVGLETSTILYGELPRVFYLDATDSDIRLAYYTGSAWGFETLDGHQNGPMGSVEGVIDQTTTGLLYNLRPHVFFYNRSNDTLRHGYFA